VCKKVQQNSGTRATENPTLKLKLAKLRGPLYQRSAKKTVGLSEVEEGSVAETKVMGGSRKMTGSGRE